MPFLRIVAVLALSLPTASTASGQVTTHARAGFWLGGGFAAGANRVGCDICRQDRELGASLQLRLGGSFSRHLRFGVEGNGWKANDPDLGVRDLVLGVGAVLYWYPNPDVVRYYLKAGLGPVFYRAEDSDVPAGETGETALRSTGLAAHIGVGYEIPAGRFAFTPFFNFTDTIFHGTLWQGDARVADVNVSFVQLGMGLTWYR